nr:hypothetical protein [Tanacetum cinerariifolium]GEZ78874.1 hypothetical protein [Tanacetum cinerariifolium]
MIDIGTPCREIISLKYNLVKVSILSVAQELIYKVHGLLVLLLELNRFRILLGELGVGQVVTGVINGILSIEARYMDTQLLSAPESNNTLARCWFRRNVPVTTFRSRGWSFIFAVPGQMTYLVADPTLDSVSWGGSIRPDGFLPSILPLTEIIIAVAIVVAVVLVVVDTIIGIVVV